MPSDALRHARLQRDLAYAQFWTAYNSPRDAFGQREAQIEKAMQAVVAAEAEANRLWQRQELGRLWREMKADRPVTGSVPAEAPQGYRPHSYQPQAFDPGECAVCSTPQGNVIHDLPEARKGKGGPSDYADPNETDPEHILSIMRSNFPEPAIEWVKRARWIGPVNIPWERIDDDSIDSWAASHQPDAVNRFARDIKANDGHAKPSILVQRPGQDKAFIVDGHHRALAHRKLGQPVLGYVGFIQARDVQAAEETHSSQFHAGTDPRNKSAQTPIVSTVHHPLGHESLWHTPDRHVATMQELPAYHQNTARALMRDQGMGEHEAIATAVNAIKEWAQGRAFGGKVPVTPEVQAAAQRADAEWEHLKATHHGG